METLYCILISTIIIALISLIGMITLGLKENYLRSLLLILVSLSAGTLIGGAFVHLLPESLNFFESNIIFACVLAGFIAFFIIEHVLKWRHCHDKECEIHTFAHMSLLGESIHNLIDGIVIAAAFITSLPLGISTTFAVAMHELPQEFGDFGVLVHAGYKKSKALLYNFLVALTVIVGGLFGYWAFTLANLSLSILLPIAAGGFIYVGASDLIPELRKVKNIKKATIHLLAFIAGIALMYLLRIFVGI